MRRTPLLLAVLLGVMLARWASAGCLDGDYVVQGPPLLPGPGGTPVADAVTIAGGLVSIASGCPPVAARIRRTDRGTVVRARWRQCGTLARRARLRALVNDSCRIMRGVFRSARPPIARRFLAEHEVSCAPEVPGCRLCRTNADCAPALYCAKGVGDCAGPGVCEARPDACPAIADPVCGCDGLTYGNRCEAAAHGTGVAHSGPCPPDACDGLAGLPCPEAQFCEHPPGTCEVLDQSGRCTEVPVVCPDVRLPVCSCDGVTYGNDCERRAAKAQKAHDGPCEGVPCEDVCDCYRDAKFLHECPLLCPNCGNYWTCEEGLCVEHCGPLPDPHPMCEPPPCDGLAGLPCLDGQFCEHPPGTCEVLDQSGRCVEVPVGCPDVSLPVCGCDGVTYGNDCERRAAKAQKAHDGPCGPACSETCDCYAKASLPAWCETLACPACGCVWACEAETCAVHVESPPPDPACK